MTTRMGMVVPPSVTHNINILLPRELRKTSFYLADLWQTTKILAKYLTGEKIYGNPNAKKPKQTINDTVTLDVMKGAKMDVVLLIIMNGNDYLPKIRGVSGGFDAFFISYFKVIKSEMRSDKDVDAKKLSIIQTDDNNKLSINVDLAIKYFTKMLNFEPPALTHFIEEGAERDNSQYQLGILHNLCEAKMLPHPILIETIQESDESYFEYEIMQLNSKLKSSALRSIKDVYGADVEIVKMTLGNYPFDKYSDVSKWNTTILGESDGHGVVARMIPDDEKSGRSYLFEVPHRRGSSLQDTKRRLACLALEEIFGKENMDLFGYDEEEESDFDAKVGWLFFFLMHIPFNLTESLHSTKSNKVCSDVKSYLAGLLWTLET